MIDLFKKEHFQKIQNLQPQMTQQGSMSSLKIV